MKLTRLDWLLLLTLSVLTFEKIRWETSLVTLTWTNLLATAFVVAFVIDRLRRRDLLFHPAAITLAGFMLAFGAVYLAGYFDLTDRAALSYWLKGIGTWAIHFTYLILGVAHMVRRGRPLFLRAIFAFTAGLVVNCVYGVIQLALAIAAGINLDRLVVGPLTAGQGGIGGINVFGTVSGSQNVYRINALTGDPNHLGVMLCVPLMVLLPYYLGDRRGRRRIGLAAALHARRPDAHAVALGRARRRRRPARAAPGAAPSPAAGAHDRHRRSAAWRRRSRRCTRRRTSSARSIAARTQLHGGSTQTHLQFYQLVPPALDPHPLFGMGFNTFAVFYQFVTGRTDFGPHSAWIAILVETGLVGHGPLPRLLRLPARERGGDPAVARPRHRAARPGPAGGARRAPAAGNLFYLTMTFDYFFALALLAVAGAAMFAPARVARRRARGRRRPGPPR